MSGVLGIRGSWHRALLSACALVTAGACLVTNSLDPQSDIVTDAGRNGPVRIDESGIFPDNSSLVRPASCALVLKIDGISDPDMNDEVSARWFVDGVMLSWSRLPVREGERREGTSYTFEVARHPLGPHSVLVAVSDGFEGGSELRAAREGKSVVSCAWAIDTSALTQCTAERTAEDDAGFGEDVEDAGDRAADDGGEDGSEILPDGAGDGGEGDDLDDGTDGGLSEEEDGGSGSGEEDGEDGGDEEDGREGA